MKETINSFIELGDKVIEQEEEIERLNKAREIDIEYNKYLQKELAKANNIIKEAREYITTIKDEDIQYTIGWVKQDILQILDKEKV